MPRPAPKGGDDPSGITLLTITEAANRLRMSKSWIYTQVRDGTVPHIRLGDRILLRPNHLSALIAANEYRPGLKKVG